MKFKSGECALHKLTAEHVLILEVIKYRHGQEYSLIDGYYVRDNNYDVFKVAEFELTERILEKEVV